MYFVLYEQITGLQASQMGCATEFRCQMTPFKRLVTGKKQADGPGRGSGTKSGRSLEEVAGLEGATPAKKSKATPNTESHTEITQWKRPRQRQRKRKQVRLSKILKQ